MEITLCTNLKLPLGFLLLLKTQCEAMTSDVFFYFSKEWTKQSVNSDTVCVCVHDCVILIVCGHLGSLILFPWSWIACPSGSVTELKTKHNWWSNTNVLQLWFSTVKYIYVYIYIHTHTQKQTTYIYTTMWTKTVVTLTIKLQSSVINETLADLTSGSIP